MQAKSFVTGSAAYQKSLQQYSGIYQRSFVPAIKTSSDWWMCVQCGHRITIAIRECRPIQTHASHMSACRQCVPTQPLETEPMCTVLPVKAKAFSEKGSGLESDMCMICGWGAFTSNSSKIMTWPARNK